MDIESEEQITPWVRTCIDEGSVLISLGGPRQTVDFGGPERHGWLFEALAVSVCLLLSVSMILNTQMGGEGVWFWYATFFHGGSHIYSDLHLPLQPLFILETNAWMQWAGTKCWQFELASLLNAALLWASIGWILRFTQWPRGTRAALHTVAFCITVVGGSYRFDDYHVVSEACILAGIAALLQMQRAKSARAILGFAALCGFLSGLSVMTRLNDGTAMAVTAAFCALFLATNHRLLAALVLLGAAVATSLLVVCLTGDTFSAWVSNSMVHAVGSKGGAGSFVWAPFLLVWRCWDQLYFRLGILASAVFATWGSRWAARRWHLGAFFLVCSRSGVLLCSIFLCTEDFRNSVIRGRMLDTAMLVGVYASYAVGGFVLLRLTGFWRAKYPWNPLEILLLIPLAEWASSSASSSGNPLTQFYAPIAMLILLLAVVFPAERLPAALRQEVLCWAICLVVFACVNKAWVPYSWQNWVSSPMYTNRTWYRHPVRGPLYIDRDLLAFSESSCGVIGYGRPGAPNATLLSIPYPYPNYFCATPPWHGYIQTFFDTTQRSVVEKLIGELKENPPEWIVYQRQLVILTGAEQLYNHGQPIAQRDLDTLIMEKIKSGQWKLVKFQEYSPRDAWYVVQLPGDGWYFVQTHP